MTSTMCTLYSPIAAYMGARLVRVFGETICKNTPVRIRAIHDGCDGNKIAQTVTITGFLENKG